MRASSIARIERLNLVIGALMTLVALFIGTRSQVLGVAVGVALTCANFYVLRKLVFRWTQDAAAGVQSRAMFLMAPKMVLLMTAVVLALAFLPISAVTFTIGYSVFILSILIDSVYSTIAGPTESETAPSTTPTDTPEKTDG